MNEPGKNEQEIRIACLLPSATDICVALGLAPYIVGVTHECNIQAVRKAQAAANHGGPSNRLEELFVLTENGLNGASSQGDIHQAVQNQKRQQDDNDEAPSCSSETNVNSLYPIISSEYKKASPTIVFTQDLCSVCAPSPADVQRIVDDSQINQQQNVTIVSLQPTSLVEVADSFVTVATACNVPERGDALRAEFLGNLEKLRQTIRKTRGSDENQPRVLLLEWLDPPFDGGHWHWILQMMEYACVQLALDAKKGFKSQQISLESISESNPDCVVVACCGFDLERNVQDTLDHRHLFLPLRASKNVYACDGNTYFACPGPNLVAGTAILAQCAYANDPDVLQAIQSLSLAPSSSASCPGWQHVSFPVQGVSDIEDMATTATAKKYGQDFMKMHKAACDAGELSYTDPETGYHVFTEVAHKKRGKCCGSGCRHCPYNHENVVDKVNRIKQPAFLYKNDKDDDSLFSLNGHDSVKVLFFSGGKDSFLTIRALAQAACSNDRSFGLVLLTTFDAESRIIAHQETHIDVVLKQAMHLDISLLGLPMHRATTEPYVDRIRRGLNVIEAALGEGAEISKLVFGDLHLEHIRTWRDGELRRLGYELEYPLWQVSYEELMKDLENSGVPCKLSASNCDATAVDDVFNRDYSDMLVSKGIDGFGENGEFHSVAEVWDTTREEALGIKNNQ